MGTSVFITYVFRLHLTPTPREKRTRTRTQQVTTSEPASKKPRYDTTTTTAVSTSASGCMHITKVDPNGGYVELKNMSNEVSYIRYLSLSFLHTLSLSLSLMSFKVCLYHFRLNPLEDLRSFTWLMMKMR